MAIRIYELLRNYGRQPAKGGIGENPDLRFHLDLDNCCSLDMLEQILLQWCRELLSPDGAPPQARNRIALSLQYIDDHLDQPLSLGELAQLTQLSPSYYSSLFKRQVGCTFCEYVQSRRISASIDLLVRTQMTVAEISRQVGFSDYRYFSRLFCRVTGMTPSHYRKENRVFPEEKT